MSLMRLLLVAGVVAISSFAGLSRAAGACDDPGLQTCAATYSSCVQTNAAGGLPAVCPCIKALYACYTPCFCSTPNAIEAYQAYSQACTTYCGSSCGFNCGAPPSTTTGPTPPPVYATIYKIVFGGSVTKDAIVEAIAAYLGIASSKIYVVISSTRDTTAQVTITDSSQSNVNSYKTKMDQAASDKKIGTLTVTSATNTYTGVSAASAVTASRLAIVALVAMTALFAF